MSRQNTTPWWMVFLSSLFGANIWIVLILLAAILLGVVVTFNEINYLLTRFLIPLVLIIIGVFSMIFMSTNKRLVGRSGPIVGVVVLFICVVLAGLLFAGKFGANPFYSWMRGMNWI